MGRRGAEGRVRSPSPSRGQGDTAECVRGCAGSRLQGQVGLGPTSDPSQVAARSKVSNL